MSHHIQRIFDFIIELDKLKSVLRKTKPVGLDRYENSAEHSWQVSLLALLLVQESDGFIDIVRIVELLLVHDIPEIDVGDQIVYQHKNETLFESEKQAAQRIFGLLPELQSNMLYSRWEEYALRETKEAKFAYAVDRLIPLLQNLNNSGQSWRENQVTLEQILKVNGAIGDSLPEVWAYIEPKITDFAEENLTASEGSFGT